MQTLLTLISSFFKTFFKRLPEPVVPVAAPPSPLAQPAVSKTTITPPVIPPITPLHKLYNEAVACLGRALVPQGDDPEYGCAISVNVVHARTFGSQIGGGTSTYNLLLALEKDTTFQEVLTPEPGVIGIAATGTSSIPNTPIANGHVGIWGYHRIMSNRSDTGTWEQFYTPETWDARYRIQGGYRTRYFKKIIN